MRKGKLIGGEWITYKKANTTITTAIVCFFFIKEPPTPLFTPKIELATLYTFDY
jgi:hypothetical protein